MDDRRRNARVQVIAGVTEQGQARVHQRIVGRCAAGWRGLQRGFDQVAFAATADGNIAIVQGQVEFTVAQRQAQGRAEGDGGVPAKRDFGLRREIPHTPAVILWAGEYGFRKPDFVGDTLHFCGLRQVVTDPYACRVTALVTVTKCRNLKHVQSHSGNPYLTVQ